MSVSSTEAVSIICDASQPIVEVHGSGSCCRLIFSGGRWLEWALACEGNGRGHATCCEPWRSMYGPYLQLSGNAIVSKPCASSLTACCSVS